MATIPVSESTTQSDFQKLCEVVSSINKKLCEHDDFLANIILQIKEIGKQRKEFDKEESNREAVLNIIIALGIGIVSIVIAWELWFQEYFWSGMGTIIFWIGIYMIVGSLIYKLFVIRNALMSWLLRNKMIGQ